MCVHTGITEIWEWVSHGSRLDGDGVGERCSKLLVRIAYGISFFLFLFTIPKILSLFRPTGLVPPIPTSMQSPPPTSLWLLCCADGAQLFGRGWGRPVHTVYIHTF